MKNITIKVLSFCLCIGLGFMTYYPAQAQQSMRANIYALENNGNTQLLDGNLTNYNNIYSNNIDIYDALKLTNPEVNFSIYRQNTNLAVERRQEMIGSDTTVFRMWNMRVQRYRLKLILTNMDIPLTKATLYDTYLQLEIPLKLNDVTYYDFAVENNSGSYNPLRFKLVYGPKPVRGPMITPIRQVVSLLEPVGPGYLNTTHRSSLEISTDGINFAPVDENTMEGIDQLPAHPTSSTRGIYYRATQTDNSLARIRYSIPYPSITAFPNPVTQGYFNLKFTDQVKGKYLLTLIGPTGIKYKLQPVISSSSNESFIIRLPKLLMPGIYKLSIIGPDNQRTVITITIL